MSSEEKPSEPEGATSVDSTFEKLHISRTATHRRTGSDATGERLSNYQSNSSPQHPYSDTPFPGETTETDNESEYSDCEEGDESDCDDEKLKEMEKEMTDEEKMKRLEEGQTLKAEGNEHFKKKEYREALNLYTKALKVCPFSCAKERSVLYSNRAAARIHLEKKEEALLDCNKAVDLNPYYVKAFLRRAQIHKDLDKLDEALTDYQRVLELDPNVLEAREACLELPEKIKERNERLKEEMIGKLKDLGNLVLKPFGLSTENFNVVQDPNTGGYSVNFQK